MKAQGQTASRFGIVLGIVVIILLAAIETFAQYPGVPAESRPHADRVGAADSRLAKTDSSAAQRALDDGYAAALASRRWEPMITHGDASLVLARSGGEGLRHPWVDQARHSYLMALFRARAAGSVEGMTRVSDAFVRMGDRDAARLALRMAQHVATDPRTAASLRDRAERLAQPQVAATR